MQSAAGWSTHWHHWQSSSLAQEHAHSRGTWIWAHGTLKCARYVLHGRSRSLVQLHHRGTSQGAPEINSMLLVWAGALTCLGADHQSQATRQRCFRFDLASERQRGADQASRLPYEVSQSPAASSSHQWTVIRSFYLFQRQEKIRLLGICCPTQH